MSDETIGDDGTPTRDPCHEFASLLIGDYEPPPHPTAGPYDNMAPEDAFGLAVAIASGRLPVPDDDLDPPPAGHKEPSEHRDGAGHKEQPRAPRPDKSQGAHRPPPPDPADAFGARVLDRLNYPPARWRDL